MQELILEKLKLVKSKFENGHTTTDVLLSNVKLLESSSRQSPAFSDPKYFPFYFKFGNEFNFSNIIQIGCKLGLVAASLSQGCKTIENWVAFDEDDFAKKIVESNMRLFSKSKIKYSKFDNKVDDSKNFDLGIIAESFTKDKNIKFLDFVWNSIKNDSLLLVDYIYDKEMKEPFFDFCKLKNREPFCFNTRYGIGVVVK